MLVCIVSTISMFVAIIFVKITQSKKRSNIVESNAYVYESKGDSNM